MRMRRGAATIAVAIALTAVPVGGAGAEPTTEVTVATAAAGASSVNVTGTLTFGTDATGPLVLADDPQGDAMVPGVGLDFGKVTVAADPVAQRLTFRIPTYDMPPVAEQTAPFYGYLLPFMVDGNDAPALFLAAGNIGANFPPSTGKFWALCSSPAGSYSCPTVLSGTMGGNLITIQLPYSRAAIKPGSTIEPGAGSGCGGVCSTIWAVLLFGNLGGDSASWSGFQVPGSVRLGIGPAATPTTDIELTATATVATNGSWAGSIAKPSAPGAYTVVARTCFGSTEEPVCIEGTRAITI